MRNILYVLGLVICCFNSGYAADISVEELVRGVNHARLTIQSGEIQAKTNVEYSAQKTEEEIELFIEKEKERELNSYVPEFNIDVKTFEKNYLIPFLNYNANQYRQRTEELHTTTLFQIMNQNTDSSPKLYQYKLTLESEPGLSLDSEIAQHHHAGDIFFLAYDTQANVRLSIGNKITTYSMPLAVDIEEGHSYFGYQDFSLFGRSIHYIPADTNHIGKENIDGAECHLLEFTAANKLKMKIWVDESIDFCVRKTEYLFDAGHVFRRFEYKDFQKYDDLWFPNITTQTNYNKDGKRTTRYTTNVISADFNLDFPKGFFKIDKSFYQPPGVGILPGFGTIPTYTPTESENLLLCGPQSLLHLCKLLKVKANIDELKKLADFDPIRGTTMKGLKHAATYKGLSPIGIRTSLELLKRKKVQLPAIAYVDDNHFLVFESVDKDGVKISDPAQKYKQHLTWNKISEIWAGQLLIVNKNKRGKQKPVPLAFTDTPIYDFGKVLGGSEIEHTFTLKNIGQEPLKILSVTETCVCTASILTQDEILPGKIGKVSSVLKVPSGNHLIQENILVHTNDPIQNTLTLTFKGEVFVPLTTFPDRFAIGTHNPFQKPLEKRISLHLQEGVKIIGVRTDSKHMKAALYKDGEIPMINLQLLTTFPVGKYSQNLLVDYSYKGEKATHNVYIYGDIVGDLHITPNRLFFGLVKDTSSFSKTITIASRDTQPFEIIATESSTKSVKVTVTKEENETSYKLTTTIDPEAKSGEVTGEVIIHTSSVAQPTVRVPFFGIIAETNVKR